MTEAQLAAWLHWRLRPGKLSRTQLQSMAMAGLQWAFTEEGVDTVANWCELGMLTINLLINRGLRI